MTTISPVFCTFGVSLSGRRFERNAPAQPEATRRLALHLHELTHRHYVVVEVHQNPDQTVDPEEHDQDAEGQRQHVIGVVGPGGDMQEEHQVHAHLGDRQHHQRHRNAGLPDQIGARDKERRCRQQNGKPKASEITDNPCADAAFNVLVARCEIEAVAGLVVSVAHAALPNKYTTVKTAIQMMSSACQNSAKHRMRRRMSALNPLATTCAIMVNSQRMPAETCSPWQPTSVKNADRNALRDGPAPCATRLANSLPSIASTPTPKMQGTAMAS